MKITRFEAFIEGSVPCFIIGLLLAILLVMGSCDQGAPLEAKNGNIYVLDGYYVREFEHDGCQYLFIGNTGIIHKANCKNHKPCE